jgi:transcriptional regulator with PAS, ATPase and Fis domain
MASTEFRPMTTRPLLDPTALGSEPDDRPLLLGGSSSMTQLRTDIDTAVRSDAKVLILGETGVGKEIAARLIHRGSGRRRQPFVAINCAGLPDSLLESELFGHVRGSFTGAYRDKPGLAALADRGTLFLDELGEMSPRMQGVLLRFVETGEIHRIGSERIEKRVDVRIIAATNRNLLERIGSGDFREDLYYRLNVIQVAIPPLRDRGDDILLLFRHYLAQYGRLHGMETPVVLPETEALLLAHRWPGNVRELKNVAERIAVRHQGGPIGPDVLPADVRAVGPVVFAGAQAAPHAVAYHPAADAAWNDMVVGGKSFWAVVRQRFMDRELTKNDVREIIKRGLQHTQGNYRKLIELFNLPAADYKRFLAFLYQHDCHLAFQSFREERTPDDAAARA